MFGALKLQDALSVIFDKYKDSLEVYSDYDFDLHDLQPSYYLYSTKGVDLATMLFKVQELYDYDIHLYYTHNMRSPLLENKKLIWRKGKWYI